MDPSTYDPEWDDPLPHSLTPLRTYLGKPGPHTRAAIIFLHGRGDSADDYADVFMPPIRQFFGFSEKDDENMDVTAISLEARDAIWWPEHHNASDSASLARNAPYVYSSLHRLHTELQSLLSVGIDASRLILVGFSQGAILVNTYLLLALRQLQAATATATAMKTLPNSNPDSNEPLSLLMPGNILALAGTMFKILPPFPARLYDAASDQSNIAPSPSPASAPASTRAPVPPPPPPTPMASSTSVPTSVPTSNPLPTQTQTQTRKQVNVYLSCGTADPYFTQTDIHDTASELARARDGVGKDVVDMAVDLQISVSLEQGVQHFVTPRQVARSISTIREVREMA